MCVCLKLYRPKTTITNTTVIIFHAIVLQIVIIFTSSPFTRRPLPFSKWQCDIYLGIKLDYTNDLLYYDPGLLLFFKFYYVCMYRRISFSYVLLFHSQIIELKRQRNIPGNYSWLLFRSQIFYLRNASDKFISIDSYLSFWPTSLLHGFRATTQNSVVVYETLRYMQIENVKKS